MTKLKNFYIFTGKGGVGKTTLSLSFSQYLKERGENVSLAYFKSGKLEENTTNFNETLKLAQQLNIPVLSLDLMQSAKAYVAKKLKSKTIAEWVVRTPFFKSLINMIPGFNYLIYVGQILELLDENPNQVIVLDAPASGHAQTMLEAPKNFNEIFKSGELYQDTKKMQEILSDPAKVKINIVTLPGQLPISEALELKKSLLGVGNYNIEILCNYAFSELHLKELPDFLNQKIQNEKEALEMLPECDHLILPYSLASTPNELIKDLVPSMESLV